MCTPPPNSNTRPDTGSNAAAAPERAGGDGEPDGVRWLHVLPSHSHTVVVEPALQIRTLRPRYRSKTIGSFTVAGGRSSGDRCVQLLPSHSQVSHRLLRPLPPGLAKGPKPPNKTTRPRQRSEAIAAPTRQEGPGTLAAAQLAPFHSQVSSRNAVLLWPPHNKVCMLTKSNAIAGRKGGRGPAAG